MLHDRSRRIGVVVWVAPRDGSAVIWAEDSAQLAYVTGGDAPAGDAAPLLAVGDMVSFADEVRGDLRLARDVRRQDSPGHPELARQLADMARGAGPRGRGK